ncbi:UNVERIFIED_CONTAM: hypothetical protein GTU68_011045, partial [Idotea baltica]|nr:hypothetical protein [Idotea baltica]
MDSKEISSTGTSENGPCTEEELECAVCLQTCVHPVRLPCSHIFCFLCVKGVANQSKRCAMCRQEIPADFLDNPNLLKKIEEKETDSEGYQWFYEGRNGWWQYDERTSLDLENAYSGGQRLFEVLVAGFLYTVDFDRMVQQRRNDPSRRRRIKRDLGTIPKKGVAGLKTDLGDALPQVEEEGSDSAPSAPQLPEQVQHPSSESSQPVVTPVEGDSSPSRPPLP